MLLIQLINLGYYEPNTFFLVENYEHNTILHLQQGLEKIDSNHLIILIYPGNSASQAIELLIKKGVPESRIIFLNLVSVSHSIEH